MVSSESQVPDCAKPLGLKRKSQKYEVAMHTAELETVANTELAKPE
jgi:hypothetical protein